MFAGLVKCPLGVKIIYLIFENLCSTSSKGGVIRKDNPPPLFLCGNSDLSHYHAECTEDLRSEVTENQDLWNSHK
jgi:hypothetical protein